MFCSLFESLSLVCDQNVFWLCFFLKAGGFLVNDPRKTNATYGGACFFILDSRTPRWRAPLPADTGGSLVNDPRKINATYGGACFFILDSRTPRWRALLPADAGGSFVNDPRKTNATYGGACFSFGSLH
jgi:hypothetical protein